MPIRQFKITILNGLIEGKVFYRYSKIETSHLVEMLESRKYKVSVIEEKI